jgi:hypothetical protein
MRVRTLAGILLIGTVWSSTPALGGGWEMTCGTEGQKPCAFSVAKFVSKQGGLCAAGQFFDPIDYGTCWTCPQGYGRTILAVNTDKACEKVASTEFKPAIENGKGTGFFGTDCPSGQFWDVADGKCHSCPSGYAMQVVEHVHRGKKCAKGIPESFSKATKIGPPCGAGNLWDPRNGGECWSCPNGFVRTVAPVTSDLACEYKGLLGGTGLIGCREGLSSIRGTCRKTGECGKQGQRPCEIGERLPSCDAGLKEDFKQNLCVALRTGETPFTGGLSSLSGYLGATLQAHCKELLGGIQLDFEGDFGVGARCGRDLVAGFACLLARDAATGHADLVNKLMETVPNAASLVGQMNTAANNSPCKELGERFAKATQHGKATGKVLQIECPSGQFWDPNGNCYSCPKDYTRTLFPVTDARSCTDKVGGNLAQFGCGAFEGVKKNFAGPIDCMVEALENGSLFDRKLDLSKADQAVCMSTGELSYSILKAVAESHQAVLTGELGEILTNIAKGSGAVAGKTSNLSRLEECAKQK